MGYNKWIWAGLGLALYGLLGALIGFIIGTLIDHYQETAARARSGGATAEAAAPDPGGDIIMSLVVLSAALMKADGTATQRELDHVRRFFIAQFGVPRAGELLIALRDVLKQEIPAQQVCLRIRHTMPYPVRLQLLHYLIGLAYADGVLQRPEYNMIRQFAHDMGVSDRDLGSLNAMFRTGDPNAAYEVLEIPSTATDDEVKQAYRRMAKKYHPDKVGQLGEDVQKAATEKFKKVQEAYETIQKQRGLK